jgi:hypothetical protein
MLMVEIQQSHIICATGWDVIAPDEANKPAGARRHGGWDEEEDFTPW